MYVVCGACKDTHKLWFSARETYIPCTQCTVPCQKCRAGGTGAYCEYPRFPGDNLCVCGCHIKKANEMNDAICRECMDKKKMWNDARQKYLKCGDCPITNEEKLKIYKEIYNSMSAKTYTKFIEDNGLIEFLMDVEDPEKFLGSYEYYTFNIEDADSVKIIYRAKYGCGCCPRDTSEFIVPTEHLFMGAEELKEVLNPQFEMKIEKEERLELERLEKVIEEEHRLKEEQDEEKALYLRLKEKYGNE